MLRISAALAWVCLGSVPLNSAATSFVVSAALARLCRAPTSLTLMLRTFTDLVQALWAAGPLGTTGLGTTAVGQLEGRLEPWMLRRLVGTSLLALLRWRSFGLYVLAVGLLRPVLGIRKHVCVGCRVLARSPVHLRPV